MPRFSGIPVEEELPKAPRFGGVPVEVSAPQEISQDLSGVAFDTTSPAELPQETAITDLGPTPSESTVFPGYEGEIPSVKQPRFQPTSMPIQEVTPSESLAGVGPDIDSNKYGFRPDGTPKGTGFLGELKRPDGGVSTEISIGVNMDGKEIDIPMLVPTLNEKEISYLLSGGRPTKDIVRKSVSHARQRISEGKSVFADTDQTIIQEPTTIPEGAPETGAVFDRDRDWVSEQEAGLPGVAGAARSLTRGGFSGMLRAGEMASQTLQWFAPEGTTLEDVGKNVASKIRSYRETRPGMFGESKASQIARGESEWNPRGWFYGGGESVGMMTPGLLVGGLPGALATGGLFWGATAQEAYDKIDKEQPDLPEFDKILYANQKGLFEGGVETLQQLLPFAIAKAIPKKLKGQAIKKIVGNKGAVDLVKDYLKMIAGEVGMEVFQEFAGGATDYQYDLRENLPTVKELSAVIGPTIIATGILGTSAHIGTAAERSGIQAALADPSAPERTRQEAVNKVHQAILAEKADGSKELANAWLNSTAKPLQEGKAITIQDDDFYRENGIAPPKEVLFDSMLLAETEEEVQGILEQAPPEDRTWILSQVQGENLEEHLDTIEETGGPVEEIRDRIERTAGVVAEAKPAEEAAQVFEQMTPTDLEVQLDRREGTVEAFTGPEFEAQQERQQLETKRIKEEQDAVSAREKEASAKIKTETEVAAETQYQEDLKATEEGILAIPEVDQKRMRSEAREEVESDPVYEHMAKARSEALDLKQIKQDYTKTSLKDIPGHQSMFTLNGRVSPDDFASRQGYESLDAMIEAFKAAPSKKKAVARALQNKVLEWQQAEDAQRAEETKVEAAPIKPRFTGTPVLAEPSAPVSAKPAPSPVEAAVAEGEPSVAKEVPEEKPLFAKAAAPKEIVDDYFDGLDSTSQEAVSSLYKMLKGRPGIEIATLLQGEIARKQESIDRRKAVLETREEVPEVSDVVDATLESMKRTPEILVEYRKGQRRVRLEKRRAGQEKLIHEDKVNNFLQDHENASRLEISYDGPSGADQAMFTFQAGLMAGQTFSADISENGSVDKKNFDIKYLQKLELFRDEVLFYNDKLEVIPKMEKKLLLLYGEEKLVEEIDKELEARYGERYGEGKRKPAEEVQPAIERERRPDYAGDRERARDAVRDEGDIRGIEEIEAAVEPKFAKAKPTVPKSTVADLTTAVDKLLTAKGRENLNISIVQTTDDLKSGGMPIVGADGTTEGMFFKGKITLVADNISPERAWSIVLHEGVHKVKSDRNWAGVFGKKSAGIMKSIDAKIKLNNPGWKAAEQKAIDAGTPSESIREETITYFLADNANQKQSLYRRIVNAIRAWAVNMGISRTITDADIVALAESSIQREARKAEPLGIGVMEFAQDVGVKLSKATDNIMANPTFRKWFGDSKVVDEDGKPLVVYHGTDEDFSAFDVSRIGEAQEGKLFFGAGFYFSDEKSDAKLYGENVVPVYLKAENILDLTNRDAFIENFSEMVPRDQEKTLGDISAEYENALKSIDIEDIQIKDIAGGFKEIQWKVDGEWKIAAGAQSRVSPLELVDDPTGMEYAIRQEAPISPDNFSVTSFSMQQIAEVISGKEFDAIKGDGSIGTVGDEFIVFSPTQIKSIYNRGTFDVTDPRIMYSKEQIKKSAKKGEDIIDQIIAKMKEQGRFKKEKIVPIIKKYEDKISKLRDIAKDMATDTTAKQKQVKDVLSALPIHVRGRAINEIVKIGKFKTKEGRQRAVDRAMGRIVTLLDQYYVSEGIKEVDKLLKKAKEKVKHGISRGTTDVNTLEQLKIIKSIREMSFDQLGSELDKIIKDDQVSEPTEDDISEMALLNTFGNLRNKTSEEIAEAVDHLNYVITTGKLKWNAMIEADRARRKEIGDMAEEVISAGKEPLEAHEKGLSKNIITESMRSFSDKSQSWQFLMEKLSRFEKGTKTLQSRMKYFVHLVHGAAHKETAGVLRENKKIQAKLKEIYGKSMMRISWTLTKNAADIKNTGINLYGKDGGIIAKNIATSQNKAYKKWMEWQDPTLRDDLKRQGVTEQTIADIEKFMTPEVKAWAEWQLDEFYPGYYDSINEVFSALTYTNMPRSDKYSPTRRDYKKGSAEEMTLDGSASYHASMMKGANKRRVKNQLNLSWEKGDGDSILSQHIAEMEHFKAWALVVRELRSVFGRQDIGSAISDHHGDTMKGVVNDFIERFVRGGIESRNNIAALDRLRSMFTVFALAMNNVVFLKQLTSIPAYAMSIPVKDFMTGFAIALANPLKASRVLMKSSMMQTRYELSRMERDLSLVARKTPAKQFTGKKNISDKAMVMTKLGDKMAIILGGYSAYRYHYKKQLKKHGDKKLANEEALREFEIITESAQQASGQKDLSVYQTGGSLQKGVTMFMTTPASYARYEEAALRNLLSGKGSKIENLKVIAITHILLPTIFQLVASGGEWDEQKMKRAWALGPLNGLFLWRDILGGVADQLFLGKSWGFSAQPHLDALYEILTNIADRGFALKDVTSLVAATRTFSGILDAISGQTAHPIRRAIGYSESALDVTGTAYKKYNKEFNKITKAYKDDRTKQRPDFRLKRLKEDISKARKNKKDAKEKLKEESSTSSIRAKRLVVKIRKFEKSEQEYKEKFIDRAKAVQ